MHWYSVLVQASLFLNNSSQLIPECNSHTSDLFIFLFCSFLFVNQNIQFILYHISTKLHGLNAHLLDCLKAFICRALLFNLYALGCNFIWIWSSALNALFLFDSHCFYFTLFMYFTLGASRISVKNCIIVYFILLKVIFLFPASPFLCMLFHDIS